MSRLSCCCDNAVAESYFKTLKAELVYGEDFLTIEQTKLEIADFIEVWYNKERLHSSIGYKNPCELIRVGMLEKVFIHQKPPIYVRDCSVLCYFCYFKINNSAS